MSGVFTYFQFPEFNQYSTTLFVLVLQGLLFAFLLLKRFFEKRKEYDLFLALLLINTVYSTTSYVIGFAGWYDTYRSTKINYFLFNHGLMFGPLVYFYLKSLTQPYFKFSRKDLIHFAPYMIFAITSIIMFVYDSFQPGFDSVQNGTLYGGNFGYAYGYAEGITSLVSQLVYYSFSIHLYLRFRQKILQYFSTTHKVELNFVRNFLAVYIFLFLLQQVLFQIIDEFIYELHWTDAWWWYFAAALAVFFIGIFGYFADLEKLESLQDIDEPKSIEVDTELEKQKGMLESIMKAEKPYFDPDMTLNDLAKLAELNPNQLSSLINTGFDKNFNDYVNEYRVDEVKKALMNEANSHLSILGIAFDCGFNSKATFNRVFKKFTDLSPSQYLASQK